MWGIKTLARWLEKPPVSISAWGATLAGSALLLADRFPYPAVRVVIAILVIIVFWATYVRDQSIAADRKTLAQATADLANIEKWEPAYNTVCQDRVVQENRLETYEKTWYDAAKEAREDYNHVSQARAHAAEKLWKQQTEALEKINKDASALRTDLLRITGKQLPVYPLVSAADPSHS